MLEKTFDFSLLGGDYTSFIADVKNGAHCSVFNLSLTEKVITSLNATGRVLYITGDFLSAKKVYELFNQLVKGKAFLLPPAGDNLVYSVASYNENNKERIKTIYNLVKGTAKVVVADAQSIMQFLPQKEIFASSIIKIDKTKNLNLTDFISKMVECGYTREPLIGAAGQFSVRGDIVDVFPVNSAFPFRVELFDDEIESIKTFDVATQKSISEVTGIDICPNTDFLVSGEDITKLTKKLDALVNAASTLGADERARFNQIVSEIKFKLENNERTFNLDYLFPLISNLGNIFDYINDDFVVAVDEAKMVFDAMEQFVQDQKKREKELIGSGEILEVKANRQVSVQEITKRISEHKAVVNQKITSSNRFFAPEMVYSFKTLQMIRYTHSFPEFINDINSWILDGYKILICAGDEKNAKQLVRRLNANSIYIEINKYAKLSDSGSAILPYELTSGFILPSEKIVVVGTYDILPRKQKQEGVTANRQDVFSVPKVGDYVVHSVHGIGVCEGVTTLSGNFGTKDYVVVRYRDNDKLYVPIEQLDMLDRFSGAECPTKLSKIGGTEFGAVKERVKSNIKKMAFDLLKLYAERESKKGFAFVKDDEIQLEFENSFPYTETEDQLKAIKEVKEDMEKPHVMDRLICGDVGFGKTEVALRAIFKAVLSGKQVAFMAPTTILSEQHYNNCAIRFKDFGINVAVLNRFRSAKETKAILKDLESGKINVICGTHRLLSKDVIYHDLGLIVLDEEQKFGVNDKEKLKALHTTVDSLTLSATPIPRTLHMSLSGIRDVSVISTPPTARIAVQTYVREYTDGLLKDAIQRELARGGQVFVVYNRVESIYAFSHHIQELLPNARIVVGHGQLSAGELEDVIYKFYNKMADVLISTTIIENGIDLPNANTLIVYDADKFGLSQLYQIRGRVGRGTREAFAYFTYKASKALSQESYKRLEALAEFTEFGSGFKIAMRDLEIRGSGNVLGAEQHGHIQKIGYNMYCKMLKNAIEELRGSKAENETEVLMRVGIDAFISNKYITDESQRMTVYKNISRIENEDDRTKLLAELSDMFGKVPQETLNLVDIAYLKSLAKNLGATEVYSTLNGIKLVFNSKENKITSEPVANAIAKYSKFAVLNLSGLPTITVNKKVDDLKNSFAMLKDFLIISNQNKKSN